MSTRRFSGRPGRDLGAERRGLIAQAFKLTLLEAEIDCERVKTRIAEIRAQIDHDHKSGLGTTITEQHFTWLLTRLSECEDHIAYARRDADFYDSIHRDIDDAEMVEMGS